MSIYINRDLPNDEYQAAINAINPSSTNPFFTQDDAESGFNINANLNPVLDNTITDPSTIIDPTFDDAYIVAVGAIGVWAGQDNNIATWDGEVWIYYTPMVNDTTTVLTGVNAGNIYSFDGSIWVPVTNITTNATPFTLAGSTTDAGGNKTNTIARTGPVVLGSNSGAYGSSPLTVRGAGSLENLVTRWGMGSGSVTGLNNWYRIATFLVNYGTSKNYQILVNIGSKSANTFASVVLHINISKTSPGASTGRAICRVVNISGPGYLSVSGDGDYRLDESNFEFRRFANAALGTVAFRLYYKPTIANSFMSATVLNSIGGTTSAIGIQWNNTFLGAAIEGPASGGSTDNYATFNYSGQRTNISAIVDPTVTDDYTLQYTVGSLWYNTATSKVWICVSSASGNAIWKLLTLTDNNNNVVLPGGLQFGGGYSAANLTANTNDLLISNLSGSALIRLSSTGNFQLTGVVVPDNTKSYFFSIFNVNPSTPTGNITFKNNDAASTAQNRFLLGNDIVLQAGEGLTFIYDPVDQRWRSPGKNI